MSPEEIVREEVRRWLGRRWTPATLWDEMVRYLTEATPEEAQQLAARLLGFAEGMRKKEAENGNGTGS